MRIHAKCSRRCCRKHCCALGGCEANGHTPDCKLDDTLELRRPLPPPLENADAEPTMIPLDIVPLSPHVPGPQAPATALLAHASNAVASHSTAFAGPFESHTVAGPSNAVAGSSNTVDKGKGKESVPTRKTLPTGLSHSSDAPRHAIHLNPVFMLRSLSSA